MIIDTTQTKVEAQLRSKIDIEEVTEQLKTVANDPNLTITTDQL